MPVYDTFRDSSRSGGVHDVQRVTEVERSELKRRIGNEKVLPEDRIVESRVYRRLRYKRYDNRLNKRWNCPCNAGNRLSRIASLAVVEIGIGCEKNFRLNLAKAIDDSIRSKIR